MIRLRSLLVVALVFAIISPASGAELKRVLLVGQSRDHPPGSHEYMAGLRVLAKCLRAVPGLEVTLTKADEPWPEGPAMIDRADGVVLYLGQGARWIQKDPARLAAFKRLADRRGGIVALHWAIGTKDARFIEAHQKLIGGIHGGPDRKFIITESRLEVVDERHPITRGVEDLLLRDEFYYRLKFARDGTIQPLVRVSIEGRPETVAWAYLRPDGGRSFGFSAMHFHAHWGLVSCRRLITQGVLWTLGVPIPEKGVAVEITEPGLEIH